MEEFGEEIRHDSRREARGVGVDQKEERLGGEDRAALGEERPEMFLEFPHLARRAAAVGGRVHNDRVVEFSAFLLAADELQTVVGDVADRGVGEAAEDGVFLAPFNHALGGVDVGDARAGFRGGDGGGAGVAEEVEDVDLATGGAGGFDFGGMGGDDSEEDSQYRKACQIVFESQKASTSWIQRQLRIGYNSAARLIDRMEEDGFISAPNHIGRREVLRDRNGDPI